MQHRIYHTHSSTPILLGPAIDAVDDDFFSVIFSDDEI